MTELRHKYITDEVSGDTAKVTNGGLDVNIQDQHTQAFDLHVGKGTAAATTISVATVVDAYTITVTSTTGFVAGTSILMVDFTGEAFVAHQVGAPAGNVITVDTPINRVYAAGTLIIPTNINMAVDGSVTRQVFAIGPIGSAFEFDVTRFLGYIQSSTAMDDGKFGDQAALSNGCVLRRYVASSGTYQNFWNVKTNGDLALIGFDFSYADKPPGGTSHGARFRITYGGQSKHGVTIRIEDGDILQFIIQDDLTGLEKFHVMAQGHRVE